MRNWRSRKLFVRHELHPSTSLVFRYADTVSRCRFSLRCWVGSTITISVSSPRRLALTLLRLDFSRMPRASSRRSSGDFLKREIHRRARSALALRTPTGCVELVEDACGELPQGGCLFRLNELSLCRAELVSGTLALQGDAPEYEPLPSDSRFQVWSARWAFPISRTQRKRARELPHRQLHGPRRRTSN